MLAILGGTGPEGKGLSLRLALAGHPIIIGSRSPDRAHAAAQELTAVAPQTTISGNDNAAAAQAAETVFLAFPYEGQRPVLEQLTETLTNKIVVTVIAPMTFQRGRGAQAIEVPAGSAAQEAQNLIPNAQIVAAFQNVSAEELQNPQTPMQGDVVVCSDHPNAKRQIIALADQIPHLRGIDGGALYNAKYVEQITPLLVNINRIYRTHSGIKITGI